MICTWNYAKKFVFIGFLTFIFGYLLVLIFSWGPHAGSLEYPSYKLITQWYNGGKLSAFVAPDTGNIVHVPVLNTSNYEFVPNFFKVDTGYVQELMRHSARQAALLSIKFHSLLQSDNTSDRHFSCRCGRVSDPCVCCGLLSASDLGKSLARYYPARSIVLQPSASTGKVDGLRAVASPPGLCVSITYRPKTGKIHLAAELFSSLDASSSQLHKGDAAQEKPPAPPNRLIMFDRLLSSPLANPPTMCAENYLADADVSLCVNLTSLSYIYDAGTEHKTAFVGCGRVQVILHRAYIVSDYGRFCFRAHRGAVDDADQKAAAGAAAAAPVANTNQAVGDAPTVAGGPAAADKKTVGAAPEAKVVTGSVKPPADVVVGQIKPPPGILPAEGDAKPVKEGEAGRQKEVVDAAAGAKEKPKPIAGSFDHNDAIRGNP